ncbi:YjiH family protein [Parashewanella spongiae]|uniref:YjiH family protein n=2 Tax=Parashewanella spongiae TaxID=342950 RepID=A0A3A6TPS3_9GAMM|nr:YjiH family protein [Parashewanella spongiae]
MTPVSHNGDITIPIAVVAKFLQQEFSGFIQPLLAAIVIGMSILTIGVKIFRPAKIVNHHFFNELFNPNWFWTIVRVFGAIFIALTFFKVGPEAVRSADTGGLVFHELLPVLFSVFIIAGLLLPLLLNFGLLEIAGALLTKIMRPLFKLPGRSAIGCITSWLGDGSVGILMTAKQYENNTFTQREAAVIATTFSAVSITFSLVVITQVNLAHLFLPFYLTVCLAGFVAAIIVPKLPPLSRKKDTFLNGEVRVKDDDIIPAGRSSLSWGYQLALEKAQHAPNVKSFFKEGLKNVADMVFGIIPVVMAIGTVALVVADKTPVFDYMGMPFIPLLELLQIPEATQASKSIVVGFADMFLPAILAASIESDLTRFVIAALSVSQLIYMSEVGALLIGSKIPVNFLELLMIFVLRTLVTLPVIAGAAHLIF